MIDLHDLLEQKNFENLNEKEQAFVLEQISQNDYEAERAIVVASQAFFELEAETIQPNQNGSNKALLALQAKNKPQESSQKQSFFGLWIAYKIPVWQAAAAMLLVFFLVRGLGGSGPKTTILIADENLRDTIFVDKYITQIKEVLQEPDTVVKVIYRDSPQKEKQVNKRLAVYDSIEIKSKINTNINTEIVNSELGDLFQYCSRVPSTPASKDTFLQRFSGELLF